VTAIHDVLRRDLNQLIHITACRAAARARWGIFRDHLHFHLATEDAVVWRPARARLAGDRTAWPYWMPWRTSTG
jgi:hypothetical protein